MTNMTTTNSAIDTEMFTILTEQATRLFTQWITPETLKAADNGAWQGDIWNAIEEAGLPLALLPEHLGGIGLDPAHAFSLLRQSSFHMAPVPLGETMLATALWGSVIDGPVSLASTSLDSDCQIVAPRLAYGRNAGHVLVHCGGDRLALVPLSDIKLDHGHSIANEPRDAADFSPIDWDSIEKRNTPGIDVDGLMPYGALLRAIQMCGAMQKTIDLALNYVTEREQFGRPIGKFQAVQHMLAEAAGHVAAACAIADNAAETWGQPDFTFAAALAKSRVGEAAGRVAALIHQVHAAMGFTREYPLHYATRRLWSWRDEFGNEAYWEERIGRLVCAQGGEALWDRIVQATTRNEA